MTGDQPEKRAHNEAVAESAEYHDASEQLAAERSFFETVLDTAGALVVVLDPDGRVVRFNKACERTTGLTVDEVRGRLLWDTSILDPDETAEVQRIFRQLNSAALPLQHENWWLSRDGGRHRIAWRNSVICGDDGRVQFVVGTGIDVTEQRELERQLVNAQKLESLGRLVGGIAHDFNNLLSPILGYTDQLLAQTVAEDSTHQLLSHISEAARRARDLTSQLLAFGRQQPMHVIPMDLNATVDRALALLRSLVKENVRVRVELEPAGSWALADPARIEQVLMNLVLNADQSMPGGGVITIATGRAVPGEVKTAGRDLVSMEVRDTGEGIPPGVLERIFEPFFSTREHGTGLGLATVHGIVAQQHGTVHVKSAVGSGTVFRVLLPAAVERRPCRREHQDATGDQRQFAAVLLVEDNDLVRTFVATTLRSAGHEVLEVTGVEAAREALASGRAFDLLLSDVVLPDGSGPALYASLAAEGSAPRTLFLSGYAGDLLAQHGIDPDANFLAKPFTADALLAKVQELLERGRRAKTPR